jgi:DNA polymerase I
VDEATLIFDIETDGLLKELTKMHVMVVHVLETNEERSFLEGDTSWMPLFNSAKEIIGHNILGFDFPALKKIFNWEPNKKTKLTDTLIYSRILNYRRFGDNGHSLEAWGEYFGQKKVEHEDWSVFSQEMHNRCRVDVKITHRVYDKVNSEFEVLKRHTPTIEHYVRAEHRAQQWNTAAEIHGWPFDYLEGHVLFHELDEKLKETTKLLQHKLGWRSVPVDMVKEEVDVKEPKWTKDGFYHASLAKWFGIHPVSGYEGEERLVEGPYCRVEFRPLKLSSIQDVKLFLDRNGWIPTEFNTKFNPITGKKENTSPKITEESLEFLGGDGKLYLEYLVISSRHAVLKTWLENVDDEGNLHGEYILIGTPSMRTRHKIICNIPSPKAAYGQRIRKLFKCKKGWKIIGADSSGNQARGLAHYLGDAEYINVLLNEDIHDYNTAKLNFVLESMGFEPVVVRESAKRILYAFLFGAAGAKLWLYAFGRLDSKNGNRFKEGFISSVPGFNQLVEKLRNIYGSTKKQGEGYIPSLAGNKIYVDSWHKLLVYLLQAAEKVTCSSALAMTVAGLEKENIPYIPLIYYHDEIQFMTPEQYAERAAEIAAEAFREAPKLYGVTIMDGKSKIGDNWSETH